MASLAEVAKAAGVSVTTASMVLNRTRQENRVSAACRERVQAVATNLGYAPNYHARSMKLGRAEMLGVALDVGSVEDVQNNVSELGISYFGQLVGAMELTARNAEYQLTIIGPDKQHRAPDRGVIGIQQRRFDGLIVPGLVVHTQLTNFLHDAPDLPIVVIESPVPTQLPVIGFDAELGMKLAIAHLRELNHRELLWVQIGEDQGQMTREQQFIQQVWNADLRGATLHVPDQHDKLAGNTLLQIEAVEAAVMSYVRETPARAFTAVVAYNDVIAIGVCSALSRLGLNVPREVSVIGFDDVEARLCIPRLTTISHQLPLMGARATAKVLEMINNDEARRAYRGTCEMITPELVVRSSTGPAPLNSKSPS